MRGLLFINVVDFFNRADCSRHSKVLFLTLWGDRQGFAVALHLRRPPPNIDKTINKFSHEQNSFAGFGIAKTEQNSNLYVGELCFGLM